MNITLPGEERIGDDLLALRRIIHHHAPLCGLDTADAASVRQFMDGTFPPKTAVSADFLDACRELRAMLILLLRLKASTSVDPGFDTVCRLWQHHDEILTRYRIPDSHHGRMALDALLGASMHA